MGYKIKRYEMHGKGPRVTYAIIDENGVNPFETLYGSFHAWTKKKDAQKVIDFIECWGMVETLKKLGINEIELKD